MLNQTLRYEKEAQRFTSLIARRIGNLACDPNAELPSLDNVVTDISSMAADVGVLKLYSAIIMHQVEHEGKHLLEGLLWLAPRCSLEMRNVLFKGNLDLDDDLATTQKKLVLLHNRGFFYNNFLFYEIAGPMFSLIQEFNQIQQSHYLGESIGVTISGIMKHYNDLSLLSPEGSVESLISNARRGMVLKIHFTNYLNGVKDLIKKAQEEKISKEVVSDAHEALIGLYKTNVAEKENFDVTKINNNDINNEDNFLINTSDISLSSKSKKSAKGEGPSIKKDVLRALKKSPSATHY